MSITNVENWGADLANIGAIYPMVGTEVALFVLGMAFWIIWHAWQCRFEDRTYKGDLEKYKSSEAIKKALDSQTGGSGHET